MTVFSAPAAPPELLTHILDLIRGIAGNAPRSQQRAIGPSEIGQKCARRLALKLLDADEVNHADRWPSVVGTAVHAWLADALVAENNRLIADGQPARWLVEQRVTIRPGLSGSCDAYDMKTHTLLDWKAVGTTALKRYRKEGPGPQYVTQAMLYGVGWRNMGVPVERVAIVFLPRAGMLPDAHMWQAPWDAAIAQQGLDRMDTLLAEMNIAEGANMLDDYLRLVDKDTSFCNFCPFYSPVPIEPSKGCQGVAEQ